MAQSSGPISQGTTAERQFTDVLWRDLFGDEAGVVGDTDGSAYAIALSTSSDVVSVGSSTIRSTARVGGFGHAIPVGSPEGITIPAASGTARTDIIALRYDPGFTGLPGPVRLTRIAGTSSALPAYDAAPPGVEDLPLWSITRQPGQALSQATTARMFTRIAPALDVPPSVPLPTSSPLATTARYGRQKFRRELGAASVPVWVLDEERFPVVDSIAARDSRYPSPTEGTTVLVDRRLHMHDGTAWRFTLAGSAAGTSDAQGGLQIAHGAGQAPIALPTVGLAGMLTENQNQVAKVTCFASDAYYIYVKFYRTDTGGPLTSNAGLALTWIAQF